MSAYKYMVTENPFSNPPDKWAPGAFRISDKVYASFEIEPDVPTPFVWHWCEDQKRWKGGRTTKHELRSRDPLHIEPSVYWPSCCGLHGFIRNGEWVSA